MTNPFADNPAPAAPAQQPAPAAQPAQTAPTATQPPPQTPAAAQPTASPFSGAPGQQRMTTQRAQPTTTAAPQDRFGGPADPNADPFDTPSGPGSGEKVTDFLGELLLVKPTEYVQGINTRLGPTDAVRADLGVLTGERQGEIVPGVLIFQMALMRELMRTMDGVNHLLLGRLGMGQAAPGKNAPYIFEDFTADDRVLARQFLEVHPKF